MAALRLLCILAITLPATATAQGPAPASADLDAFMRRVLERRDENWKKLQQYVLEERERFDLIGPDQRRLYGFEREYTWFIRQGHFVRSPLRADGVQIGEGERRRYEAEWVAREKRREARRAARNTERVSPKPEAEAGPAPPKPEAEADDLVPQFVRAAYFLRFRFEPGRYGLVGRETVDGLDTLRIEYYPERLFNEGRTRPNRRLRERDSEIEEKINKTSLVTLWVMPSTYQILKYTFDNVDWDFLPGRALVRIDSLVASMRMAEAFPSVWLPHEINGRFRMTMAIGSVEARYDVSYHDYKQADVKYKVK